MSSKWKVVPIWNFEKIDIGSEAWMGSGCCQTVVLNSGSEPFYSFDHSITTAHLDTISMNCFLS